MAANVILCSLCGEPADRGKPVHDACQERHDKATTAIPGFFRRILDSGISAQRFGDLLREAAQASFVAPDKLDELCREGVSSLVSDILEHRLVTEAEEQRIAEILENLNPTLLDSPGLTTLFAKIEILRALSDGTVPDKVAVIGPMPLELRKTESVLWIFNGARLLSAVQEAEAPEKKLPRLTGQYYARTAFSSKTVRQKNKAKAGDLVLTNYNLFVILSSEHHRRLPISRITGLRAHVDGVSIGFPNRIWTLLVSDPWFLANALTLLARRFRGVDG